MAAPLLQRLGQPEQQRRLRRGLVALLLLWALLALVRLFWALLPQADSPEIPARVINPVNASASTAQRRELDIQQMKDWHLFGEAGAAPPVETVVEEPVVDNSREGIEKGARETRLALKLRGVVASTQDGLGHAIIEYKSKQAVYAVEDKLPVPGRVSLAKVMPRVDPAKIKVRVASPFFRRFWAKGIAAVSLPNGIFVQPAVMDRFRSGAEPERSGRLIVHELMHIEQWRRLGPIRHIAQYLGDYFRNRLDGFGHWEAYLAIRIEQEARDVAASIDLGGPR